MTSNPHTNRLIHEKSPYLLQHAHNPVDWYPWGEEAFELAKKQDKPIFLSIGYATCHWCHVMEKECFEDPETAALLNDVFVNIKVDREELPEVDSIYMELSQVLMSSAGGWPLNVILTSDLKPFFAVTYLPPKEKRGLMGLQQFALHIKELWNSAERSQLVEQADRLVELFEKTATPTGDGLPSENNVMNCVELLLELADPVYGGIKGEPKFPLGYQASFLLEYAKAKSESRALFYVEVTLDRMYAGGIYDHLGGGFARYSVDERWIIPHFEKMLYDNAILAKTYLEAWKFTKKPLYQKVSEEILSYVLRDMTHPEGGFYSAEDADSEGSEGRFYTWTPIEIRQELPQMEADLFCQFFGVSYEGNFEGRSILHVPEPIEDFAEMHEITTLEIEEILSNAKDALLKKRDLRTHPFKDDKVITAWNGLMIDALIQAGKTFENEKYSQAALKAAEFIYKNLWKEKKLYRRWREGEARFSGCLDDYAFMIKAALSLFEEGCGSSWLEWALEMTRVVDRGFKMENGAFFFTEEDAPILIRKCEFYDGAEPSGNAVHAENLLRLYQITWQDEYLSQAEEIFKAAKHHIDTYPPGSCYMLLALSRYLDKKSATLVIALDEKETLKEAIATEIHHHYSPHLTVIWKKAEDQPLVSLLPTLADKLPIDGQTAVYVCHQDRCEAPLLSLEEIIKVIRDL